MRRNFLFVSALVVGASPVLAKTIDQSQRVGLTNVGNSFIVPVEFNQFDPALGALTEITLSLTASFSGTVGSRMLAPRPMSPPGSSPAPSASAREPSAGGSSTQSTLKRPFRPATTRSVRFAPEPDRGRCRLRAVPPRLLNKRLVALAGERRRRSAEVLATLEENVGAFPPTAANTFVATS